MSEKLKLLHVEDEKNARLMIADLLRGQVDLRAAATAEEALELLKREAFDLTILDWMLPGMDGGAFLDSVRSHGRAGRVVVLTAAGTIERALDAMKRGAYDFLVKPVDPEALLALVEKASRSVSLLEGAGRSRPSLEQPEREPSRARAAILGSSDEVVSLKARLELVATSDASVLIVGESGTGKELVARALHEASSRHKSRLVTVNCAAIPETLFESELFGHRKGSFTGASSDRAGLLELANGGTLFLDEVGELALPSQAKLLRALQEGSLRRVGDSRDVTVDVRVIAATNRDLEVEVEKGAFRGDLLYRLDVVRLEVPPLRERLEDLPELLAHFLSVHARAYGRAAPELTADQLAYLGSLSWPGNIRELENTAKRLVLLGSEVGLAELRRRVSGRVALKPEASRPPSTDPSPSRENALEGVRPLKEVLREAARTAILSALQATSGSRVKAAALLGVSRKTLFNRMVELGIREETSWTAEDSPEDDTTVADGE